MRAIDFLGTPVIKKARGKKLDIEPNDVCSNVSGRGVVLFK